MSVQGALALHQGVLWVGRSAKTAYVRAYDLDGRALDAGFSFRDATVGRSSAAGLAVDDERRLWVADAAAGRVRTFSLFGRELAFTVGDEEAARRRPRAGSDLERGDQAGALGQPVAVAVGTPELVGRPADGPPVVVVGSSGRRRHAVQAFELETGRLLASLRPLGDARGTFRGVRRLVAVGDRLYVLEERVARVQVFRGGEFHYSAALRDERGAPLPATAFAPLPDGRWIVAWEGADGPDGGHATGPGGLGLCDASGGLERRFLAPDGERELVEGPEDVAVDLGPDDRHSRVAVLDRAGLRVQVFTLAGRCFGAFEERLTN